jgi:hypothetical protein
VHHRFASPHRALQRRAVTDVHPVAANFVARTPERANDVTTDEPAASTRHKHLHEAIVGSSGEEVRLAVPKRPV